MNFISYKNNVTLEDIDLDKHIITVSYCGKSITYSWMGICKYRPDFDDLIGEYIDTNHSIKLTFVPEQSDSINDTVLDELEYNSEYIVEHIIQEVYDDEMKRIGED